MAAYDGVSCYLKSLNFHFSPGWLSECIDYFQANNPLIKEAELKEEVKQQWLLLDLRDLKVSVFPPNLKAIPKTVLNGKFACQVETMIDSGQSRYSQWQALCNKTCDNVKTTLKKNDDDLPARRLLTLSLTDGVQNLKAMEYEIVPCLKLNDPNLLPGFKMIISGPVVCRKGMIMLTAKNVQLCGGEVGDLIEKNRLEALLAAQLGTEIGLVPKIQTAPHVPANQVPSIENYTTSSLQDNNRTEDLFADNDDFLFDLPMDEEEYVGPSPVPPPEADVGTTLDIKQTVQSNPFVYLLQIFASNNVLSGTFKIKAVILTLKTKISIKDDNFTLKAKICDGSLSIDVEFCSDVLENLLGFSPSEMVKMVKEKSKNSAVAEKLKNSFLNAQSKLISLNCVFHVKFVANKDVLPVVMHLEEISRQHLNEMLARRI